MSKSVQTPNGSIFWKREHEQEAAHRRRLDDFDHHWHG